MTHEEKLDLYRRGLYAFDPAYYTGFTSEASWILFIDQHGKWLPEKKTGQTEGPESYRGSGDRDNGTIRSRK